MKSPARDACLDDEAAQMHAVCNALEEQGYDVLGCANGQVFGASHRH